MNSISAFLLLAFVGPVFAQDRDCAPCGTDIRFGGTYDVATRTLRAPVGDAPVSIGAVVYANTCPTSQFAPLLSGSTLLDDGEIPSTSAPAPTAGFNQSYKITSFDVSYCTRELQVASGGPGATVRVRFFQDYDDCDSVVAAGVPTADFTLTGLPASTQAGVLSCYIVTVNLSGGAEFCMLADADGLHDGISTSDGFGYALSMPNQTGTTTSTVGGFVIAGDLTQPGFCAAGDGTVFKNPGNLGTGLANDNTYFREGSGSQSTGCQAPFNGIYGGFYMRIVGALGDCSCTPNDTDNDGTSDCTDGCPLDSAKSQPGACGCGVSDVDSDGDAVPDCVDGCPADAGKTTPGICGCGVSDQDTDGDGVANCIDGCPNDPNKQSPGSCGCGIADTDSDGDGVPNCFDGCPSDPTKSNPGACGCGNPDTDNDGDGVANCIDGCPSDPNKSAPGQCGCGIPDTDSDGDGTANCVDGCPLDAGKVAPGQCGCGTPDTDSDGDGTANCNDGCPLDPAKIAPGICGCGVSDVDADGDGLANCVDNCPTGFNPLQEDCDVDGIGDACELATASFDVDTDGIPDECQPGAGTAVCFGDGSGVNCPCSNLGQAGEGCRNTSGKGALLYNFGGASVAAQDTSIYVIHMPSNKFGLVYMGTTVVGGGNGLPFGDGLRCVGGFTKRFSVQNSGPVGSYTLIDPVNIVPALITPGTTWYFQAWFRDSINGPCGKAINFSNAFRIDFVN
ncbi:MAG: thrombospondin type 3 repeat-containing protein [Planctomycetes bacterium]|nr:thrombospondin type 3 repeat-containing protein [Planctomycetota bacterium]